jgi:hypothetical protein
MLSDLLDGAKKTLHERLNNPLISGFVISWCLWNWKFLIIIFSNNTASETFHLASTVAFPNLLTSLAYGFVLPLISTLAYIFLLPYPSKFVYEFTLKRQREANEAKQKIQNETLLSVEESTILKEQFREYERQTKEKINSLNEEILSLSSRTDKSQKDKANTPIEETKLFNPTDSQFRILEEVAKYKDYTLQEKIISAIGESRVKTEYEIGELIKDGLLRSGHTIHGETTIGLTQDGRGVVVKGVSSK